jgi:hypothetical protein
LQPIVPKTRRNGLVVIAGHCTFKGVSFAGSLELPGGLQVDSYMDLDIVNRQRLGSERDSMSDSELNRLSESDSKVRGVQREGWKRTLTLG